MNRKDISTDTGDKIYKDDSGGPSSLWEFKQILDYIDVGILVLDLKKQLIEYRNSIFYQIIGNCELCGNYSRLFQLLVVDLYVSKNSHDGVPTGGISGTAKLQDRILGCTVYHVDDNFSFIFIRDTTERRRLETIAQAVNSMDSLGFIFSGIRHEIGNPMNSLKMTLSVLKQNIGSFSEQTLADYVDRSLADIGRVEYLLKSLKSFSMFESVSLADVHFGKYLSTFLALAKRDLQQRGILLTVESQFDQANVRIDPRAMNQVLLNVVANATDALDGRSKPEIGFSAKLKDGLIWLTVSDNGCGISPKQKKHLFQPFNSNKPSGNGLGLVITKKLLALMDSSIDIESRLNVGTQVTISLPTCDDRGTEISTTEENV